MNLQNQVLLYFVVNQCQKEWYIRQNLTMILNSLFHPQKKAEAAQARLAKLGVPLPGGKVSTQ